MLVTAVGEHSFNGRLLLALRVENEDTPLQEKLEVLAGHIGKFGIVAAVLLLLIGIPKYFITARMFLLPSFISCTSKLTRPTQISMTRLELKPSKKKWVRIW